MHVIFSYVAITNTCQSSTLSIRLPMLPMILWMMRHCKPNVDGMRWVRDHHDTNIKIIKFYLSIIHRNHNILSPFIHYTHYVKRLNIMHGAFNMVITLGTISILYCIYGPRQGMEEALVVLCLCVFPYKSYLVVSYWSGSVFVEVSNVQVKDTEILLSKKRGLNVNDHNRRSLDLIKLLSSLPVCNYWW